jgi:hypothetical protein
MISWHARFAGTWKLLTSCEKDDLEYRSWSRSWRSRNAGLACSRLRRPPDCGAPPLMGKTEMWKPIATIIAVGAVFCGAVLVVSNWVRRAPQTITVYIVHE